MEKHVPLDWPLPAPLIPIPPDFSPCEIPLFAHHIKAGFPSPAEEYLDCALDLNEYMIRNRTATFFFRVSGDSMINARIFDKDLLVVDRSIKAKHELTVVASIDGEFTVKKFYKCDGRVELHPENPAYQPIRFKDGQELLIWGVATGILRKFFP